MELVVEPLKLHLNVDSGKNLLEVLRANEVPISYSCMSGRCGTCRCRVVDGDLMDAGPEAGRPQTGAGRYVLACQAVLTDNCTIEVPEVDEVVVHPARIIKGTVTAIEGATHDVQRLRVRLAKPLAFSPGQYATLQFTPEHIRPYSMAGLPDDADMEFQIRRVPGGQVSAYVFDELKPGSTIRLSGPLGTAYLRRKHTGPMLCVGGGTGLAPVLSIVRGALEGGMENPIHLYFGVRSQHDLYDADRLNALAQRHPNLRVHIVVATGPVEAGQRRGLVTDAIAQDIASLAGWRAYLCGAPAMVEALGLLVRQMGMAPEHVHADAFYPGGV
ncbi:MAG: naphthalene 1,2-dioxygenase [Burkholderiales bacterium RIFCSPLOWO2_12_67_14]|nr:MAG: naphthalene 1,2-dioxygenase [Burkholderiales bacterium RIFCSPLOWO2_02_FULL_67_64]OGB41953.1 MAG: naphthalene 1,2-dioxygenase [Burkholderiales bacterium RIFCSPHIGHO2_12_FULL_67_38]OGB48040.1 MAG: naphthalene 1,2-dioxygenase [Burkholderiales bacterium RIFCSPLOWO2_12_67_14]OGB84914.1 MAG: naphthalene 1,2-dioxygenase [Burkholderiales bacterium RIFCSPLOWO2_12_FULL_67_210]